MTANLFTHYRRPALLAFLCGVVLLMFDCLPGRAQNVGDWQTLPGLANGYWDNSSNNAAGNLSTWQLWTNGAWMTETGTAAGTGYPDNNSGVITILTGTTLTNASASSSIVADGITVQSNAALQIFKSSFTLAHSGTYPIDLDVFGNLGLSDSAAGGVVMNPGATIVIESGGTMTNFGTTSGDPFSGSGYVGAGFVAGAITFLSNSLYVLAPITNKGSFSAATWQPGSTCLFAPPSSNTTNFVPLGLAGQTFYNFIWYWPASNGKNGGSGEGGSFTVKGNFAMTGNPNGLVTNEDIPYSGNTLTVAGNFGITNVSYYPTASAGTVNLVMGGNFSVDSTANIKINSLTALGNVTFNGTSAQTLGFYGPNSLGSAGNWNWTVNIGSTVNLNSAMTINGGGANPGGALNINGIFNLTASGVLTGTSNIITVAQGATFNVAQGTFTFAAEDTLEGAGAIVGAVTAGSSSVIYPNSGLPLTFQGNLTYGGAGSTNIFNLTSSTSSGNDQIVVSSGGGVTANGAQVVINPVSTLAAGTYVLLNVMGGGAITGSFNSVPAWMGTPPANSNNYSIVTTGTQVLLQYSSAVPQPAFTTVKLSGANLLVNGTNGVAGNYILLMSTNLASKIWTPVATNSLTGSGPFSFTATNAVTPGSPQQFYILKAP